MNQPLSHHLLTMAYQNAWANHRLAKAWTQLDDSDLSAPRVSFSEPAADPQPHSHL